MYIYIYTMYIYNIYQVKTTTNQLCQDDQTRYD